MFEFTMKIVKMLIKGLVCLKRKLEENSIINNVSFKSEICVMNFHLIYKKY